jgi:hypothetical protein
MDARRRHLIRAGASLAALAALPAVPAMPVLRPTETDAVTLEYTPDSNRLDPANQPLYIPGSRCANCYFYQGRKSSDYAPCTVFAGWRVSADGWCREFRPRAG